jgi:hypothetical protein
MLKLDNPAVGRLHVGDVSLAIVRVMDDFLPFGRESIFPLTMPESFRLPPMIASTLTSMSPMPYAALSTF